MTSTALAQKVKGKGRSMYFGGAREQSSTRHVQHIPEVMTKHCNMFKLTLHSVSIHFDKVFSKRLPRERSSGCVSEIV